MKRALVAVALGGLLLVGTPTLASSAQRNDTRAEKGDRAEKGGDKGERGGDKDGRRGDNDGRGDRENRRGDRDGRDGHRHGDYYYGYPGYGYGYGEPYECRYGQSGAYNCEPYGGDYGYGYGYGGGYRGGRGGDVLIRGMAFNPPETRIRPGDEVTWTFSDREPHTVTADNNSFNSKERKDGEFRLRFDQPGAYSYHCAIHPDMKGRVLVG